jgi:hypothetical protein
MAKQVLSQEILQISNLRSSSGLFALLALKLTVFIVIAESG